MSILVKLTMVSGAVVDVNMPDADSVAGLDQHLLEQQPCGVIRSKDGSRKVINFRNVELIEYTIPNPDAPVAEATQPEPTAEAPQPDPAAFGALTKADLTAVLTDAGVDHDPKSLKADLVDLAVQNNVAPPITE